MEQLHVNLGERSYPIYIGHGLLEHHELISSLIGQRQIAVVTNETVGPLYLEKIKTLIARDPDKLVILPDGEQHKVMSSIETIFDELLQARFNRKSIILALGGGVIGDMAGFAAACYQRGIDFIQLPTTLLSQVDSSVGGKTGINHPLGKNMIGAFYQPKAVIIDTASLVTLPPRELSAGLAEVIKYGLIADADFFCWLEQNIDSLLGLDNEMLEYAIRRSCEIKADVVAKDEKEAGIRAILNLGHTFGHAIETAQGYGNWLHGEAVAAGMVIAADLSQQLGLVEKSVPERARALLEKARLPVCAPATMKVEEFVSIMQVDKKNIDGKIRLVLLRQLGEAFVTDDYDHQLMESVIQENIARTA